MTRRRMQNLYSIDDEWLHGFVIPRIMCGRIFNDVWAELEEIKQEKKTMFKKKSAHFIYYR